MRAEEFDQATVGELLTRANKCFELAKSPLEEPVRIGGPSGSERYLDDAEKLRLLLEAQSYLTAVARKRDERVARRDFWMEVAVIVLIGLEIVLSVYGLWLGKVEADRQEKLFIRIDKSTQDSAEAMSKVKDSLSTLSDDQKKSLEHLQKMDDHLRESQKATGSMVAAARAQLKLLQDEQELRRAQAERKPNFVLYIDGSGTGLPSLTPGIRNFTPSVQNETKALHAGREGCHSEAAFGGWGADLGSV